MFNSTYDFTVSENPIPIIPTKSNPGGTIAPEAIIGRDELIEFLWDTLEQQGISKVAERRIGKTSVARKMAKFPREGWHAVFQDLEKCRSAEQFATEVYKEVSTFLSKRQKSLRRCKELFTAMSGTEFKGLKLPEFSPGSWKDVLESSIADLVENWKPGEERLVFFWDEMPYMLANIRDREGEDTAQEVLDVLRALRQKHEALRIVITGSIGIHHVLKTLNKTSATSLNDLLKVEVLPLTPAYAEALVKGLIRGEKLDCHDEQPVAKVMAEECDGFPFYIHHVAKALKMRGERVTTSSVRDVISTHLTDEKDPWELRHYFTRLHDYYGDDQSVVLNILDSVATHPQSISVNKIHESLKQIRPFDDREKLLELLRLLAQDHYFSRDQEGCYQFRFSLVKRWWKLHRGLN